MPACAKKVLETALPSGCFQRVEFLDLRRAGNTHSRRSGYLSAQCVNQASGSFPTAPPGASSDFPSRPTCLAKCCYTPAHMEHRDDQRFSAKRPSPASILLGLIPFAATCFSVSLWDRVYPTVLGLPFNFFWLILWLLLTPLCMWGAYRLETHRASQPHRKDGGTL